MPVNRHTRGASRCDERQHRVAWKVVQLEAVDSRCADPPDRRANIACTGALEKRKQWIAQFRVGTRRHIDARRQQPAGTGLSAQRDSALGAVLRHLTDARHAAGKYPAEICRCLNRWCGPFGQEVHVCIHQAWDDVFPTGVQESGSCGDTNAEGRPGGGNAIVCDDHDGSRMQLPGSNVHDRGVDEGQAGRHRARQHGLRWKAVCQPSCCKEQDRARPVSRQHSDGHDALPGAEE